MFFNYFSCFLEENKTLERSIGCKTKWDHSDISFQVLLNAESEA